MYKQDWFSQIVIDPYCPTPKYVQLANAILWAIESGMVDQKRPLPPINAININLDLSRDTIFKGYRHLSDRGLLKSIPGRGYFATTRSLRKTRVMILANELNSDRKAFYDSFFSQLGGSALLSLYVYNNNYKTFKRILAAHPEYSNILIFPQFQEDAGLAAELIDQLPKNKLVLLDQLPVGVSGDFGAVFLNSKTSTYNLLENALERLGNYHTLKLVIPAETCCYKDQIKGFHMFCQQFAFEREVIRSVKGEQPRKGEAFICIEEDEMVWLAEKISTMGFKAGVDIGILSYQDLPLKKYILDGISTFSTDYIKMGKLAADMVQKNRPVKIELSYAFTSRASL